MKCPNCGAAKMVHGTRDVPYTYKGESTVLSKVTGDFCRACDESILDAAESRRTMRLMLEFSKQINATIVDPAFILNVRKKLDLDQREAAEWMIEELRANPKLAAEFLRQAMTDFRFANPSHPLKAFAIPRPLPRTTTPPASTTS